MKIKKHLIAASLLVIAGSVVAQPPQKSPEEKALEYRKSIFTALSWKSGQLDAAKTAGDAAAFRQHAEDMVYLGGLITEGFIPNSLIEGSEAKPEVWEDWDGFVEKADNFQALATELASPGYDMADFDPRGFGGDACGSCHRDFKERD